MKEKEFVKKYPKPIKIPIYYSLDDKEKFKLLIKYKRG